MIADLGVSTKGAILALGGLAGAVVAIVAVASMILPKGPGPKPAVDASFEEAKVDPNVVLAQYEYDNQPASSSNASDRGAVELKYMLVADASAATSTTEEPGNLTQTTGTETVKENTEELEAKRTKEKEEKEAHEKTVEEEVRKREVKAKEAAKKIKEEAEAKEEAKLRAKEEVAIKREEEAEEVVVVPPKNKGAQGNSGVSHGGGPATRTSEEPAAPAKSFHKEGAAKVVVGTGVPTKRVDAVLREARAILRRQATRLSGAYGRSDASFEGNDPAFGDAVVSTLAPRPPDRALTMAASEAEGATLANSVPAHCGAGCALAPTVDKALADYSSNLAQAARVVAAAFRESRIELYEAKPQPVGVTVDYAIHFVGYEGELMKLEWTLDESGRPLPKTWWRKVVVKQIVPSSESIGVAGNFWAPVPPKPGDYYFSLRVLDASGEATHKTSETFR
ncbi:MAG: hypothetical protein WB998_06595 [Solirubrobacteraceae bacterium]